jgi:hypothetical protein
VELYGGWIWCFVKVKTIWEEIFANAGFTVTGGEILESDIFDKLYMPIVSRKITDTEKYLYSMWWGGYVTPGINVLLGEGLGDFSGVTVIKGDTNFRNGYYFAPYSGTYKISITIMGSYGIPPDLYIYKGGGLFTVLSGVCSGLFCMTFQYEVDVTGVVAGEEFHIICPVAMGWFYWWWAITEIKDAEIAYSSDVDPRLYLPVMTQTDFIKMICHLFALIPDVTPKDKEIRFWNYDELYDNIPLAQDWSKYLSERDDEVEFKFGDYAQNNYLKYKQSDDVIADNGRVIFRLMMKHYRKKKT